MTYVCVLVANNLELQAIGSWPQYLGLGTQAEADDQQSWITGSYQGSGTQAEADDQQSWIT